MAEENCENLAGCPFFHQFKGNPEVVKEGWIKMFCQSKDKSEKCARKKLKKETGQPPAPNMSPTGKIL